MACVPTAQLPRLGRACLLPFGFQNGSGLALPPKTHTRGESAKRWGVWVPSSRQMGHIHFARETFGSLGASSEAPTSVRPVPSQKEGRETSLVYYRGPVPSPREMRIPTGKQSCSWYQPEARRAGTTSKVSGGIRKDEKAGAPRRA